MQGEAGTRERTKISLYTALNWDGELGAVGVGMLAWGIGAFGQQIWDRTWWDPDDQRKAHATHGTHDDHQRMQPAPYDLPDGPTCGQTLDDECGDDCGWDEVVGRSWGNAVCEAHAWEEWHAEQMQEEEDTQDDVEHWDAELGRDATGTQRDGTHWWTTCGKTPARRMLHCARASSRST